MAKPYVFTAQFALHSGSQQEFADALSEIFSEVRRREDLLYYFWLEHDSDPLLILVHEAWADRDRFERSEADQPYRARFKDRIDPLLAKPREVITWRTVETFRHGESR